MHGHSGCEIHKLLPFTSKPRTLTARERQLPQLHRSHQNCLFRTPPPPRLSASVAYLLLVATPPGFFMQNRVFDRQQMLCSWTHKPRMQMGLVAFTWIVLPIVSCEYIHRHHDVSNTTCSNRIEVRGNASLKLSAPLGQFGISATEQ